MHIRSCSYGRRGWLQLAACTVFLSYAAGSYAANLGFLMNTPISYMKERDVQQLNRAARTALDSNPKSLLKATTNWQPGTARAALPN